MHSSRPWLLYLRVFICCILVAALAQLINNKVSIILNIVVLGAGILFILPSLLLNEKLELDNQAVTYGTHLSSRTVNLNTLTECDYRLHIGSRSVPFYIYHLYDAEGDYLNVPANIWPKTVKLSLILSKSVQKNGVVVNDRTAQKLNSVRVQEGFKD